MSANIQGIRRGPQDDKGEEIDRRIALKSSPHETVIHARGSRNHQDPGLVTDHFDGEVDLIVGHNVLPDLLRNRNREIFLAHLTRDEGQGSGHLSGSGLEADVFGREELFRIFEENREGQARVPITSYCDVNDDLPVPEGKSRGFNPFDQDIPIHLRTPKRNGDSGKLLRLALIPPQIPIAQEDGHGILPAE